MPEPTVCVFAPAVGLTVTVEHTHEQDSEVHLHAGGQGFWVARMAAELGVHVVLVAPFGGEGGHVLRTLVDLAGIEVAACSLAGTNGVYVHDRRDGERVVVADMPPTPLSRHEIDELYGRMLVEALRATVCVLAGPGVPPPVLPSGLYERLAHDLRSVGVITVADVAGECREAALRGGVSLLKTSTDELRRDRCPDLDDDGDLRPLLDRLRADGAGAVVVTRAAHGAVAADAGGTYIVDVPELRPVETRGAGDSMTAGLAAALARGAELPDALQLAAAAGALNVTRHGLGSGARSEIERFAQAVSVHPLGAEGS